MRSPLREKLWELCKKSLLLQESNNWQAIIIGDTTGENLDPDHFITINYFDKPKREKLFKALDFIENDLKDKPEYLIRLDDDDLISPTILSEIEKNKTDFDCFVDKCHTYIDPVYLKISFSLGNWIPNTAIHKYEHAIKQCGPSNEKLIVQDHALYWHVYYRNKNIVFTQDEHPLYYRILSPTSITGGSISSKEKINWPEHLKYLKGYGPWISIKKQFVFYNDLKLVSETFFSDKPDKNFVFWIFNYLKFLKNKLLNISNESVLVRETIEKSSLHIDGDFDENKTIECTRCLLSTKDVKNITFNSVGLCNYCEQYDHFMKSLGTINQKKAWLDEKISEIKKRGSGKDHDCILGVSGGVDSTYLAYWCKQQNLKPLVVHFDNGWNSEQATSNIQNICTVLNLQLYTIVVDWEEFKDLQLAYLRAGVIDIEALTDHAIYATILKIAKKNKIKYALSGFNDSTEGIMPRGWAFDKRDWNNIKDIYKKFGSGKKLKTYPHVNFYTKLYYYWFLKIETIKVLNYIDYNKDEAQQIIKEKLNWKELGGKHFESLFTKFYQVYILPKKFHIDKRLAHLSNLICSKQITKEQALKEYALPLYDESKMLQEKEYVIKKFGLTSREFELIMAEEPRKHKSFKTETKLWERYFKLIRLLKFAK
jgi:N-acetyl sugar amidotransferase